MLIYRRMITLIIYHTQNIKKKLSSYAESFLMLLRAKRLMNDTEKKVLKWDSSLGGFCVIKYILKNLLNYPLASSTTTSWDRIILKLYTYCSIIQQRIFYICQSILFFFFFPSNVNSDFVRTQATLTHRHDQPLATTNNSSVGVFQLSEQQAFCEGISDMIFHMLSNCSGL